MKTVDDIRTMNKNVHFRPPSNLYDINGLASLWEKKIGRTLPRVTITEDDLLTIAAGHFWIWVVIETLYFFLFYDINVVIFSENRIPESIVASFTHDIFIKGCQVNFPVDGPHDVEIGTLYPEESFRTLDECFNDFLLKLEDEQELEKNKVSTKTTAVVEPRAVTATCAWSTPSDSLTPKAYSSTIFVFMLVLFLLPRTKRTFVQQFGSIEYVKLAWRFTILSVLRDTC